MQDNGKPVSATLPIYALRAGERFCGADRNAYLEQLDSNITLIKSPGTR